MAFVVVQLWRSQAPPSPSEPLAEGTYQLQRVVDGDTIIVFPDAVIRLIGVNTPETVKPEHPVEPWGPEATAFTKHFLEAGTVRLSFDRERVDRYGRFLAYVWVGDEMLNEALLRAGLARFEPQFRYSESVKRRFRQTEQEAKRAGMGIWAGQGDRQSGAQRTRLLVTSEA
ncbi:MAG: thermonuclease family protein [Planctomycetia bacterium]|nr:thermonuclease family protein [Planctomycetia bacterium]